MGFLDLIKTSLFGLKINKVRSTLTVLGIVIGITAVIVVLSAGNSMRAFILGELESFGSDFVVVEVKVPNTSSISTENAVGQSQGITITTLTLDDMDDIVELPEIETAYAGILGQELVSYLSENKITNLYGVSSTFLDIDKSEIAEGMFFSKGQEVSNEKVVVLGHDIRNTLFPLEDPIGKKIRVGKEKYSVIGVMKERGSDLFLNQDDMIMIPITTLQERILGIDHVSFIFTKASSEDAANSSVEPMRAILRQNHNIPYNNPDKDDFSVTTMAESQDLVGGIIGGITILLIAIAGISLVVGGVGIMNIMYVSVAERTYEIGLRKAVGATRSSILYQFLIEAVAITFTGGLLGIFFGISISYLISLAAKFAGFTWPFSISLFSIILASLVSTAIGLIFGIYPARKASKLDPIVALRQE